MPLKFLLDTCVDRRVALVLADLGHEVERVALWDYDPGDGEILRLAARANQVLITRDKDFGTLAVLHGQPHAGIIRLTAMTAEQQAPAILKAVRELGTELSNSIVVVYPEQYRQR